MLHEGYTDIVDADLSKYFDTIPHSELMQCVARRIVDRQMLHLIKMWLKVPVEERACPISGFHVSFIAALLSMLALRLVGNWTLPAPR